MRFEGSNTDYLGKTSAVCRYQVGSAWGAWFRKLGGDWMTTIFWKCCSGWLAIMLLAMPVGAAESGVTQEPVVMPTPQLRLYGVRDGIPVGGTQAIVQDRKGFIWIGTRDGLLRFDGVRFTVFRHDEAVPTTLGSNDVATILVDRKDRIWSGGEGSGLQLYEPGYGFRHWRHHADDPSSLSGNDVFSIAQTDDGAIWVACSNSGLNRLRKDGKGFVHFRHQPGDTASLATDYILSLHAATGNGLWVGTLRGLDLITASGHIRRIPLQRTHPGLKMVASFSTEGHSVYAATGMGVFRLYAGPDPHAELIAGTGGRFVYASQLGPHSGRWMATPTGLIYRNSAGRWISLDIHSMTSDELIKSRISALMLDREGGLWLALTWGGVAYLPPNWNRFSIFRRSWRPGSLPIVGGKIEGLASDRHGGLWVSLFRGKVLHFNLATGQSRSVDLAAAKKSLFYGLASTTNGNLWILERYGITLLRPDGRLQSLVVPGMSSIHWAAVDEPDWMYIASLQNGVARINLHTHAFTRVPRGVSKGAGGETKCLAWHQQRLWRCSGVGLERQNVAGRLKVVKGVTSGAVFALAFGSQQRFWVAYQDHLEQYLLEPSGVAKRLGIYGVAQGWSAVQVLSMYVDQRGEIWAGTLRGLLRYNPKSHELFHFAGSEPLAAQPFTAKSWVSVGKNLLIGATRGGLLGFYPNYTPLPALRLQPRIESITLRDDQGVLRHLRPQEHTIHLNWYERDLNVTARALSYVNPRHTRYRFRLLGYDPNWVPVGSDGRRNFGHLDAGHYQLEIEAALPHGPWGRLDAPLHIIVQPPPWSSGIARVGYVLAGLLLLLGLYGWGRRRLEQRHRLRLIEERGRVAEQANASKTRFLAMLGHELRTPMTGVLGMAELLQGTSLNSRQNRYVDAIKRSGSLLLKLVNDTLDLARIEAGYMRLDIAPFNPATLVREAVDLEQSLAERKGIALRLELPSDLPTSLSGDALRIKQILLNLLSNAIKFTEQGSVRLRVSRGEQEWVCEVIDTGPGIDVQQRSRLFRRYEQGETSQRSSGSGLGLAISRELAELMGGHIELDSEVGQGSSFHVHFPLEILDAPAAAPTVPTGKVQSSAQRTVLLAEDEPMVVEVLQGMLEAKGHRVRATADGLAALAVLDAGDVDVLILDLDLPEIDGFEILRILRTREQSSASHLPVLVITARTGGGEEAQAIAVGADGFLRKPMTSETLLAAMERSIQTAQEILSDTRPT